ncbi:MAG: hypothetical protein ACJ788_02040 [Ktedonobacteraceae bacterium]
MAEASSATTIYGKVGAYEGSGKRCPIGVEVKGETRGQGDRKGHRPYYTRARGSQSHFIEESSGRRESWKMY